MYSRDVIEFSEFYAPGLVVASQAAAHRLMLAGEPDLVINTTNTALKPGVASCAYLHVPLEDSDRADLLGAFAHVRGEVREAFRLQQSVVVYCKLGRNRSLAMALLVLMAELGVQLGDALRAAREQRDIKLLTNEHFQRVLTAEERRVFRRADNSAKELCGAQGGSKRLRRRLRASQ